jgi:hypothetical protein
MIMLLHFQHCSQMSSASKTKMELCITAVLHIQLMQYLALFSEQVKPIRMHHCLSSDCCN